jgi:hypothetical protein
MPKSTNIEKARDKALEMMNDDPELDAGEAAKQACEDLSLPNKTVQKVIGAVGAFRREAKKASKTTEEEKPVETATEEKVEPKPKIRDPSPSGINYANAFGLLETGSSPVDLINELNISPDQLITILDKWNSIRQKMWDLKAIEAKYVPAWYMIARRMGELVRDGCKEWSDGLGICKMWSFPEVDSDMRTTFPGLFRVEGGKLRPKVGEHPELCAICHRGVAFTIGVQPA